MELSENGVQFPLITPAEPDKWPRGIGYRDGFRIIGTPMGFGRSKDAKLRFVASLNERPPKKHERVLMNRTLLAAMDCETRNIDVLAMDFGQTIRLGRMEIELFPAGLGPGSAQLKLSYRNRRILYCGGIRLAKPLASPPSEVPTCDVLLLDVPASPQRPSAPSRAAKDLAAWLEPATRRGPAALLCSSKTAAIDAAWVFRSLPYKIHAARGLYDLLRHSAPFIGGPPHLLRLGSKPVREGVLLVPEESWQKSAHCDRIAGTQIAQVGSTDNATPPVSASFRLGDGEDRAGLVTYIKQTGAAEVVLGRQCDESLLRLLTKSDINAFRVTHPVQIPFPFFSRRQ